MRHLDPDTLALLALGESVDSPDDRAHIQSCDECRAELDNLQHTALVARSTLYSGDLASPPERVWSRITDELSLGSENSAQSARVVTMPQRRARRWFPPVAAAAAVILVLGGVGAAWVALQPRPVTVLASAELDAFPGWTGSTGEAVVEVRPGGARVIELSLDTPDGGDGYHEVWLITSDTTELVSLGVVHGSAGTFTVPEGLDLSKYDLVDVSAEPFDGDPNHSGDSILRGQLS
jgi:Anti-sigma-K factor rskA